MEIETQSQWNLKIFNLTKAVDVKKIKQSWICEYKRNILIREKSTVSSYTDVRSIHYWRFILFRKVQILEKFWDMKLGMNARYASGTAYEKDVSVAGRFFTRKNSPADPDSARLGGGVRCKDARLKHLNKSCGIKYRSKPPPTTNNPFHRKITMSGARTAAARCAMTRQEKF